MTSPIFRHQILTLIRRYSFWSLLISLSLISLLIDYRQRIPVLTFARYDDGLFLNLANHIAQGNWLGPYNNLSHVKGPFYPLFMAMSHWLGLPILISQRLLLIGSGLLLVFAFSQFFKNKFFLAIFFALYIFNPAIYALWHTRTLRNSIYGSLTIDVLACVIGLAGSTKLVAATPLRRSLGWAIALGFFLGCFWMTREEGVWIIPALVLILGTVLVSLVRHPHLGWEQKLKRSAIVLIMPLIVFSSTLAPVLVTNQILYGKAMLTDMKDGNLKAAYGALTRVKPASWHPYIPVSRQVRQQVYATSPAFNHLSQFLEKDLLKQWSEPGCRLYKICDDYAGVWFIWALRDALQLAGYYKTPQTASAYYDRLALEINAACSEKKLDCLPPRSTLVSPWHSAYLKPLLQSFWAGLQELYLLNHITVRPLNLACSAPLASHEIPFFGQFLRSWPSPICSTPEALESTTSKLLIASGSLRAADTPIFISTNRSNSLILDYLYPPQSSMILKMFHLEPNQLHIALFCDQDCKIRLLQSEPNASASNETELDFSQVKVPMEPLNQYLNYQVESMQQFINTEQQWNFLLDQPFRIAFLRLNLMLYKVFNRAFLPIFLSLFIFNTYFNFFRRFSFLYLFSVALISIICFRILILSLINVSAFPAINIIYLTPIYFLIPLLYLLIFSDFVQNINLLQRKAN